MYDINKCGRCDTYNYKCKMYEQIGTYSLSCYIGYMASSYNQDVDPTDMTFDEFVNKEFEKMEMINDVK